MPLSTEVFVMVIFIAGGPFFYLILWDSNLQGREFFMTAYILLAFSNIFTVVEEFWLNWFFNLCEHAFITMGAAMLLAAVMKLTAKAGRANHPRRFNSLKDLK